MKNLTIIILFFTSTILFSQEITGDELLAKAIQFHDPNGNWKTFKDTFLLTMKTPNSSPRESKISINLPKEFFSVTAKRDTIVTNYTVSKNDFTNSINGYDNPSEDIKKKYNLNKERANLYKNYYKYLYGLPMKLKDEGTVIHQQVNLNKFNGEMYLTLKVTYSENVGKDSWYFYFDPEIYALEAYQFYHDESKNDGEYILLSELELINDIKMPKIRAWYYNKNASYLGTDTLSKTE